VYRFFRRFLDIESQEVPKFRLLFLTFFFYIIGLVWAGNAIRAELVNISLDFFAIAQLFGSISIIIVSLFYTAMVDSVAKDKMFLLITLSGSVGVTINTIVLAIGSPTLQIASFLMMWVLYQIIFYIWFIHWGTFIIDIYDSRTAKRLYPLLSAARPLATIVAGFSYSFLTTTLQFNTVGIMINWIASQIIVAFLLLTVAMMLRRQARQQPVVATTGTIVRKNQHKGLLSNFSNLLEGFRYVTDSPFMRWMAISALLVIALNTLTDYQASLIIQQHFSTAEDPVTAFANFTAFWDGVSNIIALLLQLLVFNSIMERLGLRNMILIFPLLTVLASSSLIAAPILIAGVAALVNMNALRRVFRDPIVGLLGNAVPARAKGRARAVINGLISPAGSVIAAALLQLVPFIPGAWFLAALLGVTTALYFISAVALRREYSKAMVRVLEQESISYLLSYQADLEAAELGVVDKTKLKLLTQHLNESDDKDFQRFLVQLISETGGRHAVPIIRDAIQNTSDITLRIDILKVFVRYGEPNRTARQLFEELYQSQNGMIRSLALQGLGRCYGINNRRFIQIAHKALWDASVDVRAQAITPLLKSRRKDYRKHAQEALDALFRSNNDQQILQGVQILGAVGTVNDVQVVLPYLSSKNEFIRYEATTAIDRLWQEQLPDALYEQLRLYLPMFLEDPVERIRLAELNLLGHFKTEDAAQTLIQALLDRSPVVQEAAIQALVKIGQPAIPQLEAKIISADRHQARLVTIVLCQIDPQKYQSALTKYINFNLDAIYHNYARLHALVPYESFASVSILVDALRDENKAMLDEIFFLLQNLDKTKDEKALAIVRESLNSKNESQRANALETLEALTSPQITRRIAPLFDPKVNLVQLAALHTQQTGADTDPFNVLYEFATADNHWLSYILLYAFGEIGSVHIDLYSLIPQPSPEEQQSASSVSKIPDLKVRIAVSQNIDIKRLVVSIRSASTSNDYQMRSAAKSAMRLLRGKSLIPSNKKEKDTVLSTVERMIVLKKVPLFSAIPIEQMQVLATICIEKIFDKDEVLFRQGDPSNELYIVVDGVVRIGLYNDDETEFTELALNRESTFFGEMTLLQGGTRSATAVAATAVLTLTIRSDALMTLMRQYPELAIELLGAVSGHLTAANARIAQLTAKSQQSKTR